MMSFETKMRHLTIVRTAKFSLANDDDWCFMNLKFMMVSITIRYFVKQTAHCVKWRFMNSDKEFRHASN